MTAPASTPSLILTPTSWVEPLPVSEIFDLSRPLEVDIGCGKGRFLLARSASHPEINFLGLDRMLRRIRKVDRKAVRAGLGNVRLLRTEAAYALRYLLPPSLVSVFYIFFPDPWPKRRHHPRRLLLGDFVGNLQTVLQPNGLVHLATDDKDYFDSFSKLFGLEAHFEEAPAPALSEDERTDFEVQFLEENKPIWRRSFLKRA